jgi:hypothetical protein
MKALTVSELSSLANQFGSLLAKDNSTKPLIFQDDPIALGCAAYRKGIETNMAVRFSELDSLKATEQDHQQAATIREFYRNRIMVRALTNTAPVTAFYHDLYELVTNSVEVQHRHLGMIYRLPYFYIEDLARGELENLFSNTTVLNRLMTVDKEIHTLVPISTIFRSRKGSEFWEYWFRNESGDPVLWTVKHNNSLRSLVESLWTRSCFTVEAFFNVGQVRNQSFYHYYISDVGFPAE